MALVLKDRVRETTDTTGTGTVTLDGAVQGFQDFSVIGDGNTTYYAIVLDTEWEVGLGTYSSSGTTLSRDVVLESSNSGSLVNFSAGTKDVFVTYPAERSLYVDGSSIVPATAATLGVASGGTGASSLTANNVLLGNGTSPLQVVAPGSNGNVLTSNGTTWTSAALPSNVASFSAGTTGFTPNTATTGAVTLGGTLAAANGGTGQSSYTAGDLLYASGTTALSKLAGVATGNVLLSGGVATAPSWGKVGLTTHVSGTLAIGNGGTGVTGTPSNGQLLIGNGSGYTLATITAGTGISVTNGAGSISIAATNNGTVTSVDVSGGTTGLTTSGGPITGSGTITLAGTLNVANGGTGATSLTANNVLLGNGTSALQVVAPGTTGNVLTSDGTTWTSAAPTGSVSPFSENLDVVAANYTIVTGRNALSVGPMTINSGVTVTVDSGQRWVVL
jgi:hypothetical protein